MLGPISAAGDSVQLANLLYEAQEREPVAAARAVTFPSYIDLFDVAQEFHLSEFEKRFSRQPEESRVERPEVYLAEAAKDQGDIAEYPHLGIGVSPGYRVLDLVGVVPALHARGHVR